MAGKDTIAKKIAKITKRTKKDQPATKSGEYAITREQAKDRIKRLKDQEAAKTVEKKGSIAKKMTVSATDIKQAKTANDLDMMQRRIDEMNDGLIKKSMQKMLDAQRKSFEGMQAAEKDATVRKSVQGRRDRQEFKGYKPSNPFEGMAKGGAVKAKSRTGHSDMRKKGLFS